MHILNYYAPSDGVVTQVLVNPKQVMGSINIATDTILAQIAKPGKYLVRVTALSSQLGNLRIGQKAILYIGESTQAFPCELTSISVSNKGSKEKLALFELSFLFEREGPMLNKGILATVAVSQAKGQSLVLPWNAVNLTPDSATVKVLEPETGWVERTITLGDRGRNRVQVKDGVKEGDIVLAELW